MATAKRFRYGLLALLLLALVALALWPDQRLVDSASAARGQVREIVEAEGRTRLHDRYRIASPVNGIARRLSREPGATLVAGDILVEIDPLASSALDPRSRAEARARLDSARARERAAAAAREASIAAAGQASRDAERLRRLSEQGLVPVEQAEQAASLQRQLDRAAASARFEAAAAAHEAELAAATLQDAGRDGAGEPISLRSPVDGLLLRRYFESEQPVAVGDPLLEVGDPTSMEIEVDVLSADAVRMREGMPVELLRWGKDAPLAGSIRRIEPAAFTKVSALGVEEQRVWVRVGIDSPREHWDRLGDAYRVTARFILQGANDVLRVPTSALFRLDGGWAVFRIEGGRARLQAVETGISGEGWTELRRGLAVGDAVIVHPERELADGERVKLRE